MTDQHGVYVGGDDIKQQVWRGWTQPVLLGLKVGEEQSGRMGGRRKIICSCSDPSMVGEIRVDA